MQIDPTQLANLGILIWTVLAVALIVWLGVGRRPREFSKPRLDTGRQAGVFLYILISGVFVWFMASSMYVQYLRAQQVPPPVLPATQATQPATGPTTAPAPMPITDPNALLFLSIVPPLLGLITLLLLDRFLARRHPAALGLRAANLPGGIPKGLLGIFIAMPLVTWSGALVERIYHDLRLETPTVHELLKTLQGNPTDWRVGGVILAAVVIAPLFEELLFRGHLQTLLRTAFEKWFGAILSPKAAVWSAIVVASAVFALAHPVWMAPMIFVLALCLGYAYERTGNLWVNITMHACFNLLSIAMYLLARHGG